MQSIYISERGKALDILRPLNSCRDLSRVFVDHDSSLFSYLKKSISMPKQPTFVASKRHAYLLTEQMKCGPSFTRCN